MTSRSPETELLEAFEQQLDQLELFVVLHQSEAVLLRAPDAGRRWPTEFALLENDPASPWGLRLNVTPEEDDVEEGEGFESEMIGEAGPLTDDERAQGLEAFFVERGLRGRLSGLALIAEGPSGPVTLLAPGHRLVSDGLIGM